MVKKLTTCGFVLLLLMTTLVACSKSPKEFVGEWKASHMIIEGEKFDCEDLELMFALTLNADGSYYCDSNISELKGEKGNWEVSSDKLCLYSSSDESCDKMPIRRIDEQTLSLEYSKGNQITLKRIR